jgi:hypothetical protein
VGGRAGGEKHRRKSLIDNVVDGCFEDGRYVHVRADQPSLLTHVHSGTKANIMSVMNATTFHDVVSEDRLDFVEQVNPLPPTHPRPFLPLSASLPLFVSVSLLLSIPLSSNRVSTHPTHAPSVVQLLSMGGNNFLLARDHTGRLPLHYAAVLGYPRVLEVLLNTYVVKTKRSQDIELKVGPSLL